MMKKEKVIKKKWWEVKESKKPRIYKETWEELRWLEIDTYMCVSICESVDCGFEVGVGLG
ncbi:hypothetical protein HanRHA438_Chr15g0726281 [Helianthus annuus]|nr:hypothetical protein HanRHA438_Chr15g0726281 [Helianthus annuus]